MVTRVLILKVCPERGKFILISFCPILGLSTVRTHALKYLSFANGYP